MKKSSLIQLIVVNEAFHKKEEIISYARRTLYKEYIGKRSKYDGCGIHIAV